MLDAQKIGIKLPFTFLKKDYKKVSLESIHQTHDQLYQLDWGFKNGQILGFESLYLNFMLT
jgi:hypothetical protein